MNGEAANGQTEVKKEDADVADEVNIKIMKCMYVSRVGHFLTSFNSKSL